MSNAPRTFVHDSRSAQKTAKAGVVTMNDLISEDHYNIMTRETANDVASHTTSAYSLNEDTNTLVESARNEILLDVNGNTTNVISLLKTVAGVQSVDDVMRSSTVETSITSDDNLGQKSTVRFDSTGIRWDEQDSALYIGGETFRIQYSPGDVTNNNIACLRIQAKNPQLGGYVDKFLVSND
jgi:hypothetical protein